MQFANTIRFTSLPEAADPAAIRFLEQRGGILEIDSMRPPSTSRICTDMAGITDRITKWITADWPRRDRVRPVHWAFVDYRKSSAFATVMRASEPSYEIVVVSHGMLAAAEEMFHHMFAHPESMASIGDVSREVAPPPIDLSVNRLMAPERLVVPRCPIRATVARHLTLLCLEMVLFHELSHLANGHLDYLDETDDPNDALVRQTLEMDADTHCVNCALNWGDWMLGSTVLREHEYPGPNLVGTREIYGSSKNFTLAILLAGYFFFRHLATPWSLKGQQERSHPLPAIRMRFLADALKTYVERNRVVGYSVDQFMTDIGAIFGEADRAFARLVGKPLDIHVWRSAFQGHERDDYFFGSLIPTWARIRPELSTYAKVAELAPVEWENIPERYLHLMPAR